MELGGAGLEHLKQLKSFTITGWVLCQDARKVPRQGAGGGQPHPELARPGKTGEGVELVRRADGSLQLGIDQPADASARERLEAVPVQDTKAKDPGEASTERVALLRGDLRPGIASGHVKFYVGTWQNDAALVSSHTWTAARRGQKIAPAVDGRQVPAMIRSRRRPTRAFRGVIDEMRMFGSAADGTGALNFRRSERSRTASRGT